MPISAILFGGRRATAVPLVTESFTATTASSSAPTWPPRRPPLLEGKVGELRRDPFAMLPFCGYNMGDYMGHWVDVAKDKDQAASEDLLRELVPQERRGQVRVAGLR